MSLLQFVAGRIHDLRTKYGGGGISQEALANHLGVAPNTISRWETGTYKPALDDLDKLARFFGVSVLEFFPPDEALINEPVAALLRAAKNLPQEDIEELRRYAEFRRARHLLDDSPRPQPGRKRKSTL